MSSTLQSNGAITVCGVVVYDIKERDAIYHLEWDGAKGSYSGLGLMAGENQLVANYWNS